MLITTRSLVWNHYRGPGHWIIHGFQLAAGVTLCLLGMLSIGSKHIDVQVLLETTAQNTHSAPIAPLYDVIILGLPLIIVLAVYLFAYVGSGSLMWLLHKRRKHGIFYGEGLHA